MLEKEMKVRKLFDSQYGMPFEQELIVWVGKDAFLKQNAAAVRALLQDLQAATRFYLDNPRAARQMKIAYRAILKGETVKYRNAGAILREHHDLMS